MVVVASCYRLHYKKNKAISSNAGYFIVNHFGIPFSYHAYIYPNSSSIGPYFCVCFHSVFVPDTARGAPDWSDVHRELTRPGVTLLLLWGEYRWTHPHGYQYTWFCQQYRAWTGKLDLVMRQTHRAGEKLFVDYASMRAQVIDPATGAVREANIFVAAPGASNYTYAEATWTQGLAEPR